MHDSEQGDPQRARAGGEERVTPLELFFDLVFVFALTQVTGFLLDYLTWEDVRLQRVPPQEQMHEQSEGTLGQSQPRGGLSRRGESVPPNRSLP
jgi:Bacterial low temperature requirement A protein (LtrA)